MLVSRLVNQAVDGQHGDGNFQHDGVDVEAGHSIGSVVVRVVRIFGGRQNTTNSHAEVQAVEGRAQVDEEGIIGSAGPNGHVGA